VNGHGGVGLWQDNWDLDWRSSLPVKDRVCMVARHEHTCTNHLSYMSVASQVLSCDQFSCGFGVRVTQGS